VNVKPGVIRPAPSPAAASAQPTQPAGEATFSAP
jgi:hypothetical protein